MSEERKWTELEQELVEALGPLVACWRAFQDSVNGDAKDAYNTLVRRKADKWGAAMIALKRAQGVE